MFLPLFINKFYLIENQNTAKKLGETIKKVRKIEKKNQAKIEGSSNKIVDTRFLWGSCNFNDIYIYEIYINEHSA